MPRTGMHLAASGSRRGQPRRPDLPQDRAAGSSEERVLFFFLSYARGDDDIYVNKFYHDLCGEIRVRTGMGRDREVGFLDTHSIEIGAPWSSKLIDALSRCRAFLALCSPAYFLSDACGKEWKIFADRMRLYEETTGVQPPALIPLVWFPPPRMPPVAEAIQYHTDVLGDAYNRDGLRQLIRLQRHRDAYLEFVSAVAEQVVSTAYTHTVPERRTHVEFHHVPNVFQADPGLSPAPHLEGGIPMDAESGPGVQYVHFVIASASRAEINPVRRSLEFYGVTAQDWAPYRPALSSSLGEYACRIAAERSFQSGVAGVEGLANRLDEARRNNQVVVLLVDVWTTRLDEHRNALVEYDQRHEPTTAVMIPWSHDDQETQQHWSELADSLRRIFMNNLIRRDDVMFRSSVLTPDAFSADLQVVLEVAKNRIFVKGTVYRRPPGELTSGRPILEGP